MHPIDIADASLSATENTKKDIVKGKKTPHRAVVLHQDSAEGILVAYIATFKNKTVLDTTVLPAESLVYFIPVEPVVKHSDIDPVSYSQFADPTHSWISIRTAFRIKKTPLAKHSNKFSKETAAEVLARTGAEE